MILFGKVTGRNGKGGDIYKKRVEIDTEKNYETSDAAELRKFTHELISEFYEQHGYEFSQVNMEIIKI